MDQGSTRKRSAVHNFAPTVTKFCVMWEGQALSHDTKFSNCRCEIVGRRVIFIWSLIHGSSWSGLIKAEPGCVIERAQLDPSHLCWEHMHPFIHCLGGSPASFNTLGRRENGRHSAEDIFKCPFLNENVWISLRISLEFVPKVPTGFGDYTGLLWWK